MIFTKVNRHTKVKYTKVNPFFSHLYNVKSKILMYIKSFITQKFERNANYFLFYHNVSIILQEFIQLQ